MPQALRFPGWHPASGTQVRTHHTHNRCGASCPGTQWGHFAPGFPHTHRKTPWAPVGVRAERPLLPAVPAAQVAPLSQGMPQVIRGCGDGDLLAIHQRDRQGDRGGEKIERDKRDRDREIKKEFKERETETEGGTQRWGQREIRVRLRNDDRGGWMATGKGGSRGRHLSSR